MDKPVPSVLHVDDDEDILAIARLALEVVGGLSIMQCRSGVEAIEMACVKAPDIFLLDVMMPDIDGVDTLRRLRQIRSCRDVPAVFMTAKCSTEDRERLMATGAVAVISKPFDPMTLSSDLAEIWQASRETTVAAE
ncbi:response regulator [Rhodobacterales bacterium HKCCSP123]|nr:response regulator [Rhodobacterales bacterium HKCCSP123]